MKLTDREKAQIQRETKGSCYFCKWWKKEFPKDKRRNALINGQCRRNPPIIINSMLPGRADRNTSFVSQCHGIWPYTYNCDYCGEFKFETFEANNGS